MSDSNSKQPLSAPSSQAALSDHTRASLRLVAASLAAAGELNRIMPDIHAAARACVDDAQCRGARAEHLVRDLKQEWYACAESGGITRDLSHRAMERLVTLAIVEYYKAPRV
jgi:hypothetical protein